MFPFYDLVIVYIDFEWKKDSDLVSDPDSKNQGLNQLDQYSKNRNRDS